MALEKPDDGGGSVVTTPKKGSSSGSGSSGAGGSGGGGGGSSRAGGSPGGDGAATTKTAHKGPPTTNNKKVDGPKRADTTQPSNPELQRLIVALIEAEESKATIEATISRLHPTWSPAMVERAWNLADRGPKQAAATPPKKAKQKTQPKHSWLEEAFDDALHSGLVRRTVKHDERAFRLGESYARSIERGIEKHPDDVAAILALTAVFAREAITVPLILASIGESSAAGVDALRGRRYGEAALDLAAVGFSIESLGARIGEKATLRTLEREERSFNKAQDRARVEPIGEPSPIGEISSAEERREVAETVARLRGLADRALTRQQVFKLADKIAAALSLSAAERGRLADAMLRHPVLGAR